jgi:hypothetical protein
MTSGLPDLRVTRPCVSPSRIKRWDAGPRVARLRDMRSIAMLLFFVNPGAEATEIIDPPVVSLVKLLMQPQAYDQKQIEVRGVLATRERELWLYFTKDHEAHGLNENAVRVRLEPRFQAKNLALLLRVEHDYATVRGRYEAGVDGGPGRISDAIIAPRFADSGRLAW